MKAYMRIAAPLPDDEETDRREALALVASDLVRLRARAQHWGSPHLASLIDGAIVQACWDAGIGPREASDEAISDWLEKLLGAARKAQPVAQYGPRPTSH